MWSTSPFVDFTASDAVADVLAAATATAMAIAIVATIAVVIALAAAGWSVQVVSPAVESSPASFLVPARHGVHTLSLTYSFAAQPHSVSLPEASSPAGLVKPPPQAVHTLLTTWWLALQKKI